jgi:hypothetical protein
MVVWPMAPISLAGGTRAVLDLLDFELCIGHSSSWELDNLLPRSDHTTSHRCACPFESSGGYKESAAAEQREHSLYRIKQ